MPPEVCRIDELITPLYTSLTPSQRRLADYVLQYMAEAALLSSKELARKLSVSEATIVRFAQRLGFEGYPEFRHFLQRQLLRDLRSSERVASLLHTEDARTGPLQQMVQATIQQVQLLQQTISEEQLARVVEAITQARCVVVFGEGAPAAPTVQLGFWLNRLGILVRVTNQTGRRFFESLMNLTDRDLALVFAFRRIGPEATALIEHMAKKGGRTVLFTDVANSGVHPLVTYTLKVYRGPMGTFRPLGAVTALCDAIILGVMLARGDRAVQELKELDDLRQRYGFL